MKEHDEKSKLIKFTDSQTPPNIQTHNHVHEQTPDTRRIQGTSGYTTSEPPSLTSSTEIPTNNTDYQPLEVTIESDTQQNLKVGNLSSLMHLVKGNVGTGILAMPNAVNNAGLWLGTLGILLIGGIAVHCMHMLLNCSHILRRREKVHTLDYAETLETAFKTGPDRYRKFSKAGRGLVNVFLLITQFGFCCIYLLFVAQNIKQVVDSFWTDNFSQFVYIVFVAILLIPYTFVKELKVLSPFSTLANCFNFLGLAIIYQYLFRDLPDVSERPAVVSSVTNLPLYFGTVIFSYEGIGLVMPIENKMKYPEDFPGLAGVMNLAMAIVSSLYTSMGFYGYLKFGDKALGSITLNLPQDDWLYRSVNLMFAISLFISYGLMFYVPMKITWPYISKKISSRKVRLYAEYPYRISLVIFTFGIAAIVPHLDLLISLLGAFASCSLALMLPPVIEIITLSVEQGRLPWWKLLKDILIILFGFLGFVTGTYSALKEIINTF